MKISIKELAVAMELKNKGIELDVRSPDGKDHLGDLVVTKSNLIWCKGQTRPANGKKISWKSFVAWAEGQQS